VEVHQRIIDDRKREKVGTLYLCTGNTDSSISLASTRVVTTLCHHRLGHMSEKGMQILHKINLLPDLKPLALDQVLGDPWSSLTYFGTSTTCQRWSARRSKYRGISTPFWVLFGIWEYVMGMGCRPMGLPMFRPIL
jgi:hypothetical protein